VHGRDAATPVPIRPKWTLADLVDHVGATQRMVAMLVGADVAVRGPAAELLLVISRRRPLDAAPTLELHGDRTLLDHWIEHMDWVTDG
jgi:hypothetical protein